jgi:hypothetical protein
VSGDERQPGGVTVGRVLAGHRGRP